MFAEDVELLPRGADGQGAFIGLLRSHAGQPARLVPMLRALWRQMDSGGFSERLGETLLRFNGKLFKGGDAPDYVLTLTRDQIELLQRAASADWREVEPAIFGTLLERALDPTERHALGAHYTPRAYVERLVLPAVIEPLRADWADAQAAALLLAREAAPLEGKKREAKLDEARLEIRRFHHQLCNTRVLDPACGSGNFLYVTLEHLKRLEAEVLDYLGTLGDTQAKLGLEGETVTLQQLRGIELNRRAATLAELVLWIGWLQWHIRSFGNRSVAEPVVHDYGNIECRDAVLAWDAREPALDATGQPVTRWDGKTFKPHPVTGELVPDDTAQTPQWRYVNPCRAEWPQADFIVGNPPFIGSKRMRSALGDGYVDALQQAWPEVPDASDFVMRWWHKAALQTRQGETRRFGFITSNSLRQIYVRRAVEPHLLGDDRLSILMAIPDHPWVDSADGAAVRIAMTVAEKGVTTGLLREVTAELETSGETEDTVVSMAERCGLIGPDLRVGANLASASPLQSHQGLCAVGMKTIGAAFQIDQPTAINLGLGTVAGLENHIRPYLNGRDFVSTPRNIWVIDFFGLDADEVRQRFPAAYQHLADRAKPERDLNRNEMFRRLWWIIGHPRQQFREATRGLSRYIVTVETAKHNIFAFLPTTVVPDSTLVTFAFEDAYFLGVLSSLSHIEWALAAGGRLGVGNDPRYNKTRCFETFPFPAEDTGLTPALAERIRVLAEQIDAHRKQRQAAHDTVTLTGLYNVLAKLRSGEALNAKDKVLHRDGLVSVLQSLHDELDAAVLQAYGWADLGAVPWADAAAREAWTEALLERLVALNTRRAAEEATGLIRWLRPDFQDPARRASAAPSTAQPISLDLPAPPDPDTAPADTEAPAHDATRPAPGATAKKPWPSDNKEQLRSVAALLAASPVALSEAQIAGHYTARGPWKKRLPDVLATLEAVARARCDGGLWRGV
jgi:hypothetical protein